MPTTNTGLWSTLERQRVNLFLVGGVLVLFLAVAELLQVFTDMHVPHAVTIGLIGHIIAFIGVLGFHPELSQSDRLLADAGAISAALGALGMLSTVSLGLAALAGVLPETPPPGAGLAVPLAILGTIVGYSAFGAASLRAENHADAVGYVLFVPAIFFGLVVIADLTGGAGQFSFILTGGQALGFLGIGFLLRMEDVRS